MVRKTKNQCYDSDSDDEFNGECFHIHGGALESNQIRGLLDASYDKTIKDVEGGWKKDEDLSTGKSKVFYNPETGKTSVIHRGTVGTVSDWANNAAYALGGKKLYKTTDRYKHAKDVQRAAEAKYGADNITTLGHSQGGLQAELLGKKGKETFTLNKATRLFSNKPSKNQTDIRTTTDLVSALNPFSKAKNNELISLKGFNPLKAHSTKSMKKIGNKLIGKGIDYESESDSESSSSSEEEYIPRKRGRPKGGAILGKLKKGFKKEIIKPNKEAIKYITKKDGLATDLLYKGVPMAFGTLGGVAGTMVSGGPVGSVAGNYAGQMAGKLIARKIGRETKLGSENQRGVGTKERTNNKTVKKYLTSKKGGITSDLLHRGIPTVLGGLGGVVGGDMGTQAGSMAGQIAGDYVGEKIGVGLKRGRGRPKKDSVNIDIDFNSHNAGENSKTMTGGKLKKGSPEMAEKMARLRALKKK